MLWRQNASAACSYGSQQISGCDWTQHNALYRNAVQSCTVSNLFFHYMNHNIIQALLVSCQVHWYSWRLNVLISFIRPIRFRHHFSRFSTHLKIYWDIYLTLRSLRQAWTRPTMEQRDRHVVPEWWWRMSFASRAARGCSSQSGLTQNLTLSNFLTKFFVFFAWKIII